VEPALLLACTSWHVVLGLVSPPGRGGEDIPEAFGLEVCRSCAAIVVEELNSVATSNTLADQDNE
jgi:hypothetical protein